MNGWSTDEGFVLGKDIRNNQSPPRQTNNQLSPIMTTSNRSRASLRLKSAQGKVMRAIRVQRRMQEVQHTRKNARNNWHKSRHKLGVVLGFKHLGNEVVQQRKRSIFGNVRGGAIIDDASMPRVSLHSEGQGSGAPGMVTSLNRHGSGVQSMTLQSRHTTEEINAMVVSPEREVAHNRRMVQQRTSHTTPEQVNAQIKKKALRSKMKGAIGKVKKFVRVVRLSYSDGSFGEDKVSLTELLSRLRNHYDPDGVHRDVHDDQHAFYTDLALLQRESLKHDPRIRSELKRFHD